MRKLSKKILSVLAIASIMTTTANLNVSESFAYGSPYLTINGNRVSTSPIIKNGRTLVPIRVIGEELGSQVDYNANTQEVSVVKSGIDIKLIINQTNPTVNGVVKPLDVAATIINGRTYVPVRFISESFGINVDYNQSNNEVVVGTPSTTPLPPQNNNNTGNNTGSSNQVYTSFDRWEDAMEWKFGDDWNDRLEYSLKVKYGESALDRKYGDDWDDRLEYAIFKNLGGKIPSTVPTDIPSTLTPINPTTPPSNNTGGSNTGNTGTTGTLTFNQWENQMEWKFGDDWNDAIENRLEYKYGEDAMEYTYGDDWDDRLEYKLYLYYGKKVPSSLNINSIVQNISSILR